MAYYASNHPNPAASALDAHRATGQWAYPTRQGVTLDTLVVHSAESFADQIGEDRGAENVTRYGASVADRRVSWNVTTDSDSIVWFCPIEWTCFHAGSGWNRRSAGIEQAFQAHLWPSYPQPWKDAVQENTAVAAAAIIRHPAARIDPVLRDKDRAREAGGIIPHGTARGVPGLNSATYRTDPGWAPADWQRFMTRLSRWLKAPMPELAERSGAPFLEDHMATLPANPEDWWRLLVPAKDADPGLVRFTQRGLQRLVDEGVIAGVPGGHDLEPTGQWDLVTGLLWQQWEESLPGGDNNTAPGAYAWVKFLDRLFRAPAPASSINVAAVRRAAETVQVDTETLIQLIEAPQ